MADPSVLKAERSTLKGKVSTGSNRLIKSIKQSLPPAEIKRIFVELQNIHLDFTIVDEQYKNLINSQEELKEEYEVVNGLDLDSYSDSVEAIMKEASITYTTHEEEMNAFEETNNEERYLSETMCKVHVIKLQYRTQMISLEDAEEELELGVAIEELSDLLKESEILMGFVYKFKMVNNNEAKRELSDLIEKITLLRRKAKLKIKKSDTSSQNSRSSIPNSPITSSFPTYLDTSTQATSATSTAMLYPPNSIGLSANRSPFSNLYLPSSSVSQPLSQPYLSPSASPFIPATSVTVGSPVNPVLPGNPPRVPHYHQEVKVRRSELPKFSGERADWPEFKTLWNRLAIPAFSCREILAKELRDSMTGKNVKDLIGKIKITGEGTYDIMWGKLCGYYDDVAASVEAATERIYNLKPVKEEDYKGIVKLVDEVEGAYCQLIDWNQLNALTSRDVEKIVNLLPMIMKREWNKMSQRLQPAEKLHPFPTFMSFLVEERITYANLAEKQVIKKTSQTHAAGMTSKENKSWKKTENKQKTRYSRCAVHTNENCTHQTKDCKDFKKLDFRKKFDALRSIGACFRCLGNHKRSSCQETNPCKICDGSHPTVLCKLYEFNPDKAKVETNLCKCQSESRSQTEETSVSTSSHANHQKTVGLYAVASVPVKSSRKRCTVFLDNGSDSSYISEAAAKRLGAKKLQKYLLEVTTTGGIETAYESTRYSLDLVTKSGRILTVKLFGISKITGKLAALDIKVLQKLFPGYDCSNLQRESRDVDVLLGTDYFGVHPKHEVCTAGENLSIMEGALGITLQGSHPLLQEDTVIDTNFVKVLKSADVLYASGDANLISSCVSHPLFKSQIPQCKEQLTSHFTQKMNETITKFIEGEELATQVQPICGACKCGKCPQPGHSYSFEEERQLRIIQNNLRYDEVNQHWITSYPWKIDPQTLPNNKNAVHSCLQRLMKKLRKNPDLAETYNQQILDMVERGVARNLTTEEEAQYEGPCFYINHLGVPNPKSTTTPYRIVFNSSQKFKGISLNDSLYKGPDAYINNQLGVLLRWREENIGIAGDVKKMYNAVFLEPIEQQCHRFLWSKPDNPSEPSTYVITRVNMGDRPAGAIATEALYKTAEMFSSVNREAAEFIKNGSYVDDLINSVKSLEVAKALTSDTEKILAKGNFNIKFWIYSGQESESVQILGVTWKPKSDTIIYNIALNFSIKKHGIHVLPDLTSNQVPSHIPEMLTKRMVLSQVMSIYDPMGFLSPLILYGKILLRTSWESGVGWDDALPKELCNKWIDYFVTLYKANDLSFPRSMKPNDAMGDPMLILFSDASDLACGFCGYVRWLCSDNTYKTRLVISKGRVAPLVRRSTPQLELNAAVMSKRGRDVIEKESRYKFTKVLHIVDSETVLSMLQKTSTRFKLYEGLRISEIQAATSGNISCWAWVAGDMNPADWITRGKQPSELHEHSTWFNGPEFLSRPEETWPIKFTPSTTNDLSVEKVSVAVNVVKTKSALQYTRVSKYTVILHAVSRVLHALKKKTFSAVGLPLEVELLHEAELIIIKDVQKEIYAECNKEGPKGRRGGIFYRLKPVLQNGIWVVGSRLVFNPMVPENAAQALLPTQHPITILLMKQAHVQTIHGGRDRTLARFRCKFWIPHGGKIAASVVRACQLCKIRSPKLLTQRMGLLPVERSTPTPPFTYVMIDYFGPYTTRGEVQKRISGKAWGVLFTDLVSRAVFIEAAFDYGVSSFLMALSKFASIRGYPRTIFSDCDSKFVCASKELNEQWKLMWENDKEKLLNTSAAQGLEWKFSPPDSPWQNGAVEALVKSVKRAIHFAVHDQRLSPTEFSCILYEISNCINERPIGFFTSQDSELSVITPNSLLMGRSCAKNPGGWQPHSDNSILKRYHLVQTISETFWKQWIRTCAPNLMVDSKWHSDGRDLKIGDVVLVLDDDSFKSQYRLAIVTDTFPSADKKVRKVKISYKQYRVKDTAVQYTGSFNRDCIRSVQKLALIVPVDESS